MYRFRQINRLLEMDSLELKNQYIYFSDLPSLNDPMEGFYNLYWEGDKILWKNLLRHYILCLDDFIFVTQSLINDDELIPDKIDNYIHIFNRFYDLSKSQKKRMDLILSDFFSKIDVDSCINNLVNIKGGVDKDNLILFLSSIHVSAVQSIYKYNFFDRISNLFDWIKSFFIKIVQGNDFVLDKINEEKTSLFLTSEDILHNPALAKKYLKHAHSENNKDVAVYQYFPERYVELFKKLMFSDSYVACFITDISSSVLWSHYADNHRGVALKFKTQTDVNKITLSLKGIDGVSGAPFQIHTLNEVKYINEQPRINSFFSLGRLPEDIIKDEWFTDVDGSKSMYNPEIFTNFKNWRDEYYNKKYRCLTSKGEDWRIEKEYRIILSDGLKQLEGDGDIRKVKYDFNELESITFGIRTPFKDKVRIIDIIFEKCKNNNRDCFEFYQAKYDPTTGKIYKEKILDISNCNR